jgi:hypothetical protein
MGEKRKTNKIFVGKPEGKRPSEDLGLDWGNIKIDLKSDVRVLTGLNWQKIGTSGGQS